MAFSAGTIPFYNSLVQGAAGGTTYTKNKEVTVGDTGTITVSFTLIGGAAGATMFGRIYKNGTAVGTERSVAGTGTLVAPNENIAVTAGDKIQIYTKYSGLAGGYIKDFKLMSSAWVVKAIPLQDV